MGLWAQLQREVQNGKQHTEEMAVFKEKRASEPPICALLSQDIVESASQKDTL